MGALMSTVEREGNKESIRRDIIHNYITNQELFIRFVGTMDLENNQMRIQNWINRCAQLVDSGLSRIYFMIHQPADNRGKTRDAAQDPSRTASGVALQARGHDIGRTAGIPTDARCWDSGSRRREDRRVQTAARHRTRLLAAGRNRLAEPSRGLAESPGSRSSAR